MGSESKDVVAPSWL